MAVYAYLACPETRDALWLGKALRRRGSEGNLQLHGFWRADSESPPYYSDELLNRAVWKFLAEHAGKELRVMTDDDSEPFDISEFLEVTRNSTLADYVGSWPNSGEDA